MFAIGLIFSAVEPPLAEHQSSGVTTNATGLDEKIATQEKDPTADGE